MLNDLDTDGESIRGLSFRDDGDLDGGSSIKRYGLWIDQNGDADGEEIAYGAYLDGENVRKFSFPDSFHLVLGNEANGISDEITNLISKKIYIPNYSKKTDSLNVSVATSIFLYEISNKFST